MSEKKIYIDSSKQENIDKVNQMLLYMHITRDFILREEYGPKDLPDLPAVEEELGITIPVVGNIKDVTDIIKAALYLLTAPTVPNGSYDLIQWAKDNTHILDNWSVSRFDG